MARPPRGGNLPTTQTKGGALAIPEELAGLMVEDAGLGVGDQSEVGIPFLYILQDMSPQVQKRNEKYIQGADVGYLYNNVAKLVIPGEGEDDGIDFIPCVFEPAHVEWRPNRGGFVAKHPKDTPLTGKVVMVPKADDPNSKIPTLPGGNTLQETKYYYGFYRPHGTDETWEPAVIGMASSMIACSRRWQGMIQRVLLPNKAVAPSFARIYHLRTEVAEKGDKSWFVWLIAQDRWVNSEEYSACRDFARQILAGTVKVSSPDPDGGGSEVDHRDETVL